MSDPGDHHDVEQTIRDAMRALDDDEVCEAPPADVWEHIAAAIDPSAGTNRVSEIAIGAGRPAGRRTRRWLLVAAAVLLVAIAGVVAVAWYSSGDGDVVSTAQLSSDGLDGAPAGLSGSAEVIARSGRDVLHVEVDGLKPRSGEFLELWLITPDVSGMVSLGAIRPDGTYAVPPGLRIDDYPVVDISTEPHDGNPSHSGASLLRGTLEKGR